LSAERTNPITPAGFAAMCAEYEQLMAVERPRIVEVVSWAAGNGDRSENGDYIYGRQKLRDIDRRAGFLARRMKAAQLVDPAAQADHSRVWFGATVTIADANDVHRTVTLVGDDECDASTGRIGWSAPLARALRGAAPGDVRRVTLPSGEAEWEVIALDYPPRPAADCTP
jgi:transcription elongation factor GreB